MAVVAFGKKAWCGTARGDSLERGGVQGAPQVKLAAKNRRYPRIGLPKGMYIAWQRRGLRTVARVATLGLGGLFIHAEKPPAVGEVIRVFFEVPGGEVRATAVVRDSQPGKGMGIEFAAMEPEPRARLLQLLRRLQGDSDSEPTLPHA
jgi:PilZ domain